MNVLLDTAFEAALIDLDGTLVDTVGDFEAALANALADIGLAPVSRAFVARSVGKGTEHLLAATLAEAGAPAAAYAALWPRYLHHYEAVNGTHATVYPGVAEGLAALKARGLKLVCLSNKPGAFARALLASKGLLPHFEHVFGGDAFERKKPDPLPLLKACAALHTLPTRTLMVGDSSNDARAARAAGCPVVLLSYGYNHGEPAAAARPDAVINRLDELPALLAPR